MNKGPRTGTLTILATAYDVQLAAQNTGGSPWRRALKRSDVVEHIVWAVVGRWWDPRNGECPAKDGVPAGNAARDHLRDIVGKHWDDIDALCRAGMSLSAAGLAALTAQDVHTPPKELSERVVVRIGAVYRQHGSVPRNADLPGLVTDLVASFIRTKRPRLRKARFREKVAGCYDEEWERRGVHSLAAFRPSLVGLGEDVRPALAPPRESGGWDLGLRRSIWGRYRLFWDPSAASRTSPPADDTCRVHDEHERLRDLRETDQVELACEEIRRACSPYGLAVDEHRGVLLAISHGLDLAESVATGPGIAWSWREWSASRCAVLDAQIADTAASSRPDPALVATVRDFSTIWRRSPAGVAMEDCHGPLTGQLDLVLTAVARKTWMDLHRREREHVEAMRRTHVMRAIRMAFTKGIPEALQRRRNGLVCEPGIDEGDSAMREQDQDERSDQERANRTFGVLLDYATEVASWREKTLSGDLSWFPSYEEIIGPADAAAKGAQPYLAGTELARILGEDWSDPA